MAILFVVPAYQYLVVVHKLWGHKEIGPELKVLILYGVYKQTLSDVLRDDDGLSC